MKSFDQGEEAQLPILLIYEMPLSSGMVVQLPQLDVGFVWPNLDSVFIHYSKGDLNLE